MDSLYKKGVLLLVLSSEDRFRLVMLSSNKCLNKHKEN